MNANTGFEIVGLIYMLFAVVSHGVVNLLFINLPKTQINFIMSALIIIFSGALMCIGLMLCSDLEEEHNSGGRGK